MTSNELEIFKQSILDDVRVMMQTTGQVTQYIGARYVPLFADPLDWSNTKEYEPLTIVLYQGNSFTSRQFVPKGIDISNTDFWANTGNYNAQIEQYRQEVNTFDARITANAENLANEVARSTAFDSNSETGCLYLGNSWTQGAGDNGTKKGLYERTKDLFDYSYATIGSGTPLIAFEGNEVTFENFLDGAISNEAVDNSRITDVIIMSSICDSALVAAWENGKYTGNLLNDFTNTLKSMKNKATTAFPRLKNFSVVWLEGRRDKTIADGGGLPDNPNYFHNEITVDWLYREACSFAGVRYLGWIGSNITVNPIYFSDPIHPNTAGYDILEGALRSVMTGCSYNFFRDFDVEFSFGEYFTNTIITKVITSKNFASCNAQTLVTNFTESKAIPAGTKIEIPYSSGFFNCFAPVYDDIEHACGIIIFDNGETSHNLYISSTKDKIYLYTRGEIPASFFTGGYVYVTFNINNPI